MSCFGDDTIPSAIETALEFARRAGRFASHISLDDASARTGPKQRIIPTVSRPDPSSAHKRARADLEEDMADAAEQHKQAKATAVPDAVYTLAPPPIPLQAEVECDMALPFKGVPELDAADLELLFKNELHEFEQLKSLRPEYPCKADGCSMYRLHVLGIKWAFEKKAEGGRWQPEAYGTTPVKQAASRVSGFYPVKKR